ncbi:MAG: serine/threonine-protein kinase [Xanthomonadales bacterium]|jgi:tetratricopeptide (TPR) repeat protein|nr:serine/threonine-protein kinase [Xanthomonadales bacterium]
MSRNPGPPGDDLNWHRIDEAFARALEQPAEKRRDWVEGEYASDPSLRDAVLALLDEESASAALFEVALSERDAIASAAVGEEPSALGFTGKRLGPYRLTELIATGGMGAVYRAERDDGEYDQTVAIKILPAWVNDEQTVRRLRAERQILSSLQHPHITRLLDGGQTQDGYPYLVTEFIDGQEIIHYARENGLGLEARLDLFLRVADAVQYAHEQGVIHRDLKPANILVDAQGRPHLLDFGIAKLTEQADIPLSRLRTATGFTPMTPEYASPEQAAGADVGLASDVYQLGLLLYELLTGQRPAKSGFGAGGAMTRPSAAVRGRTVAEADQAETLVKRARTLRGDLDTIVLKALRPEPEARYRSARALARDLRHFRAGEAIEARPESFWSAGKRLARHYPVAAGLGLALFAVLAVSAISLSFYSAELERQRDEAARQAVRAGQARDVLIDVFRRSDPLQVDSVGGAGASVWASLDAAAEEARTTLADDPEVLAELLATLSVLQDYAGEKERSIALLEESAALYTALGPAFRTEALMQTAELANVYAATDRARADALRATVEAGLPGLIQANPPGAVTVLIDLGVMDYETGDYSAALEHFDLALALLDGAGSESWSDHIEVHFGRGNALIGLGRLDDAAVALETSLALTREHFGETHGRLTGTYSALSGLERLRDNPDAAVGWAELLVDLMSRNNAPDYEGLLAARNNLALAYGRAGRQAEQQAELRQIIEVRRASEGATGSRDLGGNLKNLASSLQITGDLEEARAAVLEARTLMERHYPAGSPIVATAWFTLGLVELETGATEAAAAAFEETLGILEPVLGNDHIQVHVTRCYLAETERLRGRPEAARSLAPPALAGIRASSVKYPDYEAACEATVAALGP